MRCFMTWFILITLTVLPCTAQEKKKTRDQMVREDREKVTAEGFWIYNDLPQAFEKARKSGRPLLVVLRCIPCHECVKLDDELVDRDPILRPLLEQFVCVRVVSTNGLDLSLFQYDTDQSFAVFMLNADRTIYGRFGTRSHRTEWIGDVSLKGLAAALNGALELHSDYPANAKSLMAKTGGKPLFDRPELFPALKEKFTDSLNYSGDVAKSCIHCHQIGDALREYYRGRNETIPENVLSPYPHPKSLGLIMDPDSRSAVKGILPESIAAAAGFQSGDQIQALNGQPILSTADIQWVLHNLPPEDATVDAKVSRGEMQVSLSINLPAGWRRLDDISWRVTSWGLRRMVTGGLVLEAVPSEDRAAADLPKDGMALQVKFVGQYGPHAAGQKAGFKKDDVIVSYDGRTDLMTDSAILRYGVTNRRPGDSVPVSIIRNGKTMMLNLPMQE